MRDSDDNYLYEVTNSTDTVPNIYALNARGISIDYHPAECFNLFLPIYKKRQDNLMLLPLKILLPVQIKKPTYQTLEQEVVNTQSGHHSQLKK